MKRILLALTITFSTVFNAISAQDQQTIKVTIDNIKTDQGAIQVGLYNTKATFLKNTYKTIRTKAKKGSVEVIFKDIPKGEYAISLYHDVDNDNQLDTFWRIPQEPYNTSNNAKRKFGPPLWKDAKFNLDNQEVHQTINL
ncbi:DUF2141 domain-containing protein [Aquimarina algicola]|uniref:DUF2141 domain-containing protein n=1 Tax=Aquimarina algicola TaxID=2589995 RepID=A0A504JFH7_9FLAO|nr:DUF2141 domain-containing protein [Aquimarina algicola]TPN85161.1 DUF2141 domain-containing protein [Aquimarina algicola]